MKTPMAVKGMFRVETDEATLVKKINPSEWSWTPNVRDLNRLTNAVNASSQTSKATFSKQTDYGENK